VKSRTETISSSGFGQPGRRAAPAPVDLTIPQNWIKYLKSIKYFAAPNGCDKRARAIQATGINWDIWHNE
jgi:hypothetical protein